MGGKDKAGRKTAAFFLTLSLDRNWVFRRENEKKTSFWCDNVEKRRGQKHISFPL